MQVIPCPGPRVYSPMRMNISPVSAQSYLWRRPETATGGALPADRAGTEGFNLAEVLQQTSPKALSLARKMKHEYAQGEVIVKLAPGLTRDDLGGFAGDYGAQVLKRYDIPEAMRESFGGELLRLQLGQGMTTPQAIAAMEADRRVVFAASNDIVSSKMTEEGGGEGPPPTGNFIAPQPPGFPIPEPDGSCPTPPPPPLPNPRAPNDLDSRQWALTNTGQTGGTVGADISAQYAWGVTVGKRQNGPIIALVDSGIDYNHPDLRNNMWVNPFETPGDNKDNDNNGIVDDVHGACFHPHTGDPMDDNKHGTHVAGIIAAEANNGQGVAGVMWEGQLMALKFLDANGRGKISEAIEAILYATSKNARITTQAWGSTVHNQALYEVLKASPALHVIAAGNDRQDNDTFPIYPGNFNLPNCVTVAASTHDGKLSPFSNRGHNTVHLAAPGLEIWNTTLNGGYASMGGTAAAVGHVAGVAGLIVSKYPEVTNDQLRTRILSGVVALPTTEQDRVATGGIVNAYRSLEEDHLAPQPPMGLRLESLNNRGFKVGWLAQAEDGCAGGPATRYELRYSTQPMEEPGGIKFEDGSNAGVVLPRPGQPGSRQNATVTLSPSGRQRRLNVLMVAVDNVGNRSNFARAIADIPGVPVAYEADFENGSPGWVAEGSWGMVPCQGRGKVWTDSPDGSYQDGRNDSLTSPWFSLKGWKECRLNFESYHEIEKDHDFCKLEIRQKDGSWSELASYDGHSDWAAREYDLSGYSGKTVQVRFRLQTDDSRTSDGIYIDNFVVTGRQSTEETGDGGRETGEGTWAGSSDTAASSGTRASSI